MIQRIHEPAMRQQAAQLFGQAIQRRWQVSAQEAIAWVEAEFMNENSMVFVVMRDRRMRAVICGCPLSEVSVPLAERQAVANCLGLTGDEACLPTILHIGGLAVSKGEEHHKFVRPLHEAVREEAHLGGYTYLVGQTLLPTRKRGLYAHHWMRIQPMGWRVLQGVASDRAVRGTPITWLVLP